MIGWALIAFIVALALIEQIRRRSREALGNFVAYAGYLVIGVLWGPLLWRIYSLVHDHAIFELGPYWLDPTSPRFYASWLALFVLEDLAFYAFHRSSHRFPLLWASHVTHHSSRAFDLSTSLRQTWTPFITFPFWLPLPLIGFDPLMVLAAQFLSLGYQAFLHTELIPHLGPLELVFNTPQHHRVHHGANTPYRDRNFGGVLIIWDRLFGTYAELSEPVRYGIDRDAMPHPLLVGVHGWIDLARKENQ